MAEQSGLLGALSKIATAAAIKNGIPASLLQEDPNADAKKLGLQLDNAYKRSRLKSEELNQSAKQAEIERENAPVDLNIPELFDGGGGLFGNQIDQVVPSEENTLPSPQEMQREIDQNEYTPEKQNHVTDLRNLLGVIQQSNRPSVKEELTRQYYERLELYDLDSGIVEPVTVESESARRQVIGDDGVATILDPDNKLRVDNSRSISRAQHKQADAAKLQAEAMMQQTKQKQELEKQKLKSEKSQAIEQKKAKEIADQQGRLAEFAKEWRKGKTYSESLDDTRKWVEDRFKKANPNIKNLPSLSPAYIRRIHDKRILQAFDREQKIVEAQRQRVAMQSPMDQLDELLVNDRDTYEDWFQEARDRIVSKKAISGEMDYEPEYHEILSEMEKNTPAYKAQQHEEYKRSKKILDASQSVVFPKDPEESFGVGRDNEDAGVSSPSDMVDSETQTEDSELDTQPPTIEEREAELKDAAVELARWRRDQTGETEAGEENKSE